MRELLTLGLGAIIRRRIYTCALQSSKSCDDLHIVQITTYAHHDATRRNTTAATTTYYFDPYSRIASARDS